MTLTVDEIYSRSQEKMQKAIASTRSDLGTLRTGRPNPSLLDRLVVDYYGTPSPIGQMANISVQDGGVLVIQPYDKGQLSEIEKAISKSDLGLTPNSDGTVLRLNIPPLSTERRQEIAKMVKKMGEEGKVAIRNIRRDATDELGKMKKDALISEDDLHGQQQRIQKLTDASIKDIDKLVEEKEIEILKV
jgi:ribosome recycling factor